MRRRDVVANLRAEQRLEKTLQEGRDVYISSTWKHNFALHHFLAEAPVSG
jgi:hypothetical protein